MQNMQNQKSALGLDANIAALIAYPIGILALILVFIEKDNKFVRFHAIQSLLFWAAVFGLGIVCSILITMLGIFSWALASIISMIVGLIFLGLFVGMIFLAYKAFQGQMFKLPVLGDMAEKWT